MQKTTSCPSSQAPIAFIGGGNMARALIGGLVARGISAHTIRVAEPVESSRDALVADFGVAAFAAAADAVRDADTWLFAIKPQVMRKVCADLSTTAQMARPLVVSIAAGITSNQLDHWLGGKLSVIRAMPNTPALLGEGVTGLFANAATSAVQRGAAQALLASAGATVWIEDEALMDAVTAVSGSGPAYVFLLAEAMQSAGEAQGLPAPVARLLAQQTLLGASQMLIHDDADAAGLRRRVTSPGGTTQAAIESLQAGGFEQLIATAIAAATERGRALAQAND